MGKYNADISEMIRKFRLLKWEVAAEVGVSDATFSRWLRKELSLERHEQVLRAIKKLSEGGNA